MSDLMRYKNYYGSVHFEEDDLIFHGKIEFIRALITYEATNARDLKAAFHEAVDDYLVTCEDHNIKPETPFKGSLNVRLGSDLHKKIALAAEHQHISINKFILETLNKAMHQE